MSGFRYNATSGVAGSGRSTQAAAPTIADRRSGRAWVICLAVAVLLPACGDLFDSDVPLEPLVAKGNAEEILASVNSGVIPQPTPSPTDEFAQKALDAVNQARAQARVCGDTQMPAVGPVLWNDQIAHAALLESEWMQSSNSFGHAWPDGTRVGDRLDMVGYRWLMGDENIAAGFPTIAAAVQAWLDSPPHCRAFMRGDLSELGMAVVPGQPGNTYNTYWTMVLAEPARSLPGTGTSPALTTAMR